MSLFGIALILMKHNRPTLARSPHNSLLLIFTALSIAIIAIAGNIALGPQALLSYATYLVVILIGLWLANSKVAIAKLLYWTFEQNRNDWIAQRTHFKAGNKLVKWIRSKRTHPVIYFTKTDVSDL